MICPQCGKIIEEKSACAYCGYKTLTMQEVNLKRQKPSLWRGIKRFFMILFFPISMPILIYKNTTLSENHKKKLLLAVFAVYLLIVAASAGSQMLPNKASPPTTIAEVEKVEKTVGHEEASNLKAWSKIWVSAFLTYPKEAAFLEDAWRFSAQDDIYEVSGRLLATNDAGGKVAHTFILHVVKDSATGNGRCIDLAIDGESYVKGES